MGHLRQVSSHFAGLCRHSAYSTGFPLLFFHLADEFGWGDVQPPAKPKNRIDRWHSVAAFDERNIPNVETRSFRQFFLRDSGFRPEPYHDPSNNRLQFWVGIRVQASEASYPGSEFPLTIVRQKPCQSFTRPLGNWRSFHLPTTCDDSIRSESTSFRYS